MVQCHPRNILNIKLFLNCSKALLFCKQACGKQLDLVLKAILYRIDVLVLNLCQQAFKSYGLLSRVIHEEERKIVGSDIQLQIAL